MAASTCCGRGDGSTNVVAEEVSQVVEGADVLRVRHGNGEDIVLEGDRHDLVDAGHGLGDEVENLGGDVGLIEVDDRHPPLLGEGFGDLGFSHQSHTDRHLTDDFAGALLLLFEHVPQLILVEVPEVDQNLSELTLCHELCGP